ncbi:zinc finger, CCHC-type containing protein [Tanacetum coccineum]
MMPQNEVACLMLGSMSPELQRTLKNYKAYDMIQDLKIMFEEQAKHELFETVKAFHACKQEDVSHVSLILNSLNKDYDQFVQNYNMHSMGKTLAELHAMLKLHEKGAKGNAKGKNKLAYAPKTKIPPPPKRDNPAKDLICHHCNEVGYWRRNCPSYHVKLKKRKNASVASTSGCGTQICNTSQGLRESRKLKHGALSMYM